MARPIAINFASWRKSLLEDYVKRYNVPLPNQGKYTRRDYIDAIRDDQRQFKNLATKNYHTLLEIALRNYFKYTKYGYKRKDFEKGAYRRD